MRKSEKSRTGTLLGDVKSFCSTLAELPLYCFRKNNKNNTSLCPQGSTSRSFFSLAVSGNRQKSSSLLHSFTRSAFTLIERKVGKASVFCILDYLDGDFGRGRSGV